MKYLFALLLTLCSSAVLLSQTDTAVYSKIKIDLSNHSLAEVTALGIETDHGLHKPGKYLINIFDEGELALLDRKGVPYSYLIKDVKAFYKKYGTMDENELSIESRDQDCEVSASEYVYTTPENYEYGTMGGYLTYGQALANMDKMQELYPDLITKRLAIGDIKTHQNRSLYYMVISNSPDNLDPAKPQILYDALHHAREPNSLSNLLFYMWFLLENYGKDEEITYLVDNTAMFFLPIVNPDGYVYNELTDPSGGGLWRKNRYPNADGDTVGVDLNRNYGYFWAFDDNGSSPNEGSQVYRGPAAFSEPETQAVRQLCNDNNFQIALNYHTYGNLLIHPWGYSDEPTEEDLVFKSLARVMATDNDFRLGTGSETVGYVVNGDSDDWLYGEQLEKNKIYSMTPEIGPSFWPGETRIDQLNKSTVRHNLNAAHLLHNFGWVKEQFPVNTITSAEGTLFFQFEKSGLLNGPITLELVSTIPEVTISNGKMDANLVIGETLEFQADYQIADSYAGTELEFVVNMDNGKVVIPISFMKKYDERPGIDYEEVNTVDDLAAFNNLGSEWGLTNEDFFSEPFSITDSPGGRYSNNTQSQLYLLEPLETRGAEEAYLKFQTKFQLEEGFDYVQVSVVTVDGVFHSLCGELTRPAEQFSDARPLYDGELSEWTLETICLNDFLWSDELVFLFSFFSDGAQRQDGFYFDDLTFEVIGKNYLSKTEHLENKIIAISPNPTNELIRISMHPQNFMKGLSCEVYDLAGRKVFEGDVVTPQLMIDASSYEQGTYTVVIKKEGKVFSNTRFIKN